MFLSLGLFVAAKQHIKELGGEVFRKVHKWSSLIYSCLSATILSTLLLKAQLFSWTGRAAAESTSGLIRPHEMWRGLFTPAAYIWDLGSIWLGGSVGTTCNKSHNMFHTKVCFLSPDQSLVIRISLFACKCFKLLFVFFFLLYHR